MTPLNDTQTETRTDANLMLSIADLAPVVARSSDAVTPVSKVALGREVSTSVVSAPISDKISASKLVRPQWKDTALPYLEVQPTSISQDPIRAGEFLLWPNVEMVAAEESLRGVEMLPGTNMRRVPIEPPDPDEAPPRRPGQTPPILPPRPRPIPLRQAFFALAVPHLLDFSLTVQSTVQPDRSIRITGGTAVLTVGVYAQEDVQTIDRYQQAWTAAIDQAGYGNYVWKFLPVNLRNLQAALELPAGHSVGDPQISTNTNAGTATLIIQLSEIGVLAWKTALEQRNGSSIPGIFRLTASYFGRSQNRINIKQQEMSAPLGGLLVDRGPESIRVINPQQTVEAKLLVIGNDLIQNVLVSMVPNVGQAPETQVFGRDGGQVSVSITTQNVTDIEVNWTAQVSFKSANWPVIPTAGKLSNQDGWAEMIKPDSWIANYNLMAVFVDRAGKPAATDAQGRVLLPDANGNLVPVAYQVNGVLTFTAPYIPTTNMLVTPFDAKNQSPVIMALPRFPNQPFGDLVLNMFATLDTPTGKLASTQTRKLSPTELGVVVIVHPDAQLEIKTSRDALPEVSTESEMMGILEQL